MTTADAPTTLRASLLLLTCLLGAGCYATQDDIEEAGGSDLSEPAPDDDRRADAEQPREDGEREPRQAGCDGACADGAPIEEPPPVRPGPAPSVDPIPEQVPMFMTTVGEAVRMAADDEHVYWLDAAAARLMRFDLNLGETTVLAVGLEDPQALFLGATRVFFVADAGDGVPALYAMDKSGEAEPRELASVAIPTHFAQDEERVYFMDGSYDGSFELFAVAKAGGEVQQLTRGGPAWPQAFAIDAERAYLHRDEAIHSLPKAGGELTLLRDAVYYADEMLVVGDQLLVTSSMDGNLVAYPTAGGAPTTLSQKAADYAPLLLVPSGEHVYYSHVGEDGSRTLWRVGLDGEGEQRLRMLSPQSPDSVGSHDILFDVRPGNIYYVEAGELILYQL